MSSYIIPFPTGETPPVPSVEKPDSRLDHDFNFQIVVFEVYFPSQLENLHMKKLSQHLSTKGREYAL